MPHRVYVILLDENAICPGTGDKGAVYVGETGLTPEQRFARHKQGGMRTSRVVTEHGVRLMPELYADLPTFDTREEAEALEALLKQALMGAGWRVCGGDRGISGGLRGVPR